MATITTIDELNSPKEFNSQEYIRNYFKPMRLSKERKQERQDAANDFLDILLFILSLIAIENERNLLDWNYIQDQFQRELLNAARNYAYEDEALQNYVAEKAYDFVNTTRDHDLEDPYWTSDERATYEAVNEAQSVVSLGELQRAKELGAIKKRWKTERDNRVRFTHRLVDGRSVPIDQMFEVGDALMRFPGDFFHSVRESVNCRCCLEYLTKDDKVVMVGKRGTQYKSSETQNEEIISKELNEQITTSAQIRESQYEEKKPEVIADNVYIDKDGTEYKIDGKYVVLSASPEEIETAKILAKTYGFDVHLVPRVLLPQGIKTPDYIMDGRRIDRKRIDGNGKYVMDNALKNKKDQANEFIFAIGKTDLTLDDLVEQAKKILNNPYRSFVKKIYIQQGDKIIKVIEK